MAINPSGGAQATVSVFGGYVSESPPVTLPEGVSPAAQDVQYVPAGVQQRPCLKKVYATPLPAGGPNDLVPTVVYSKTFITPTGDIEQFVFDSNGVLWLEDVSNNPGVLTQIGTFTPGSWAKSCTADGREYIAISDALHGSDVPVQYNPQYGLDRVTQDGPGVAVQALSLPLPSVALLAVGGSAPTYTIAAIYPSGSNGAYFTTLVIYASGVTAVPVGASVTVTGTTGSVFLGTYTVLAFSSDGGAIVSAFTALGTAAYTPGSPTGTLTYNLAGTTLSRTANLVTANTTSAHNLLVGYMALITGIPAAVIGSSISSIVIDNEDFPGIATLTMAAAHGLSPGIFVSITGVAAVDVGGGIASVVRTGTIVTVTTNDAFLIAPGSVVTLAGVSDASFNSTASVLNVTSPTTFTFEQSDIDSSSSGGNVTLNWPVPNTPTPTYYEVIACPTPTTFQVAVAYSDGTWTSGSVSYAWDGTFFVKSVPSPTTFTYQQYGPDATTTTAGTVTPYGQAAPGQRQVQCHFLTRNGLLTKAGPPLLFTTEGGQYISVSGIPVGPPNVVARVLSFTGVFGADFFWIESAQENGQIVAQPTIINDNVSTSALLDFSDPTLLEAEGVSIPGNQVNNQIVIDGALSFGFYASRLVTNGQRNRLQNLLNCTFDGGYVASSATTLSGSMTSSTTTAGVSSGLNIPNGSLIQIDNEVMLVASGGGTGTLTVTLAQLGTSSAAHASAATVLLITNLPTGWTGSGGTLAAGRFGLAWGITGAGTLQQSFYQDCYGNPIATANAPYLLRAWVQGSGTVTVTISSASTGFSSSATLAGTSGGAFSQAAFSLPMPNDIPSDLIISLGQGTGTSTVDELSVIYAETPYLDALWLLSYVDNPEAFDGLTGKLGSTQDTHKVMDFGIIRQTINFLTQDPGGRLHQVNDSGTTEPAGWTVNEIAAQCGLVSAFGLTKSQADDSSASGGEEFMAWVSADGARIFGGGQAWLMSREILPDWIGANAADATPWSSAPGISPAYLTTAWALNVSAQRRIYFGLPIGGAGAATMVYYLDYRGLSTSEDIGQTGPIRISFTGKLIATDHSRKWAPWNMTINGAALVMRTPGQLTPMFFGGNGQAPGAAAGYGNVYTLDSTKLTDDDYGQIAPYYTTYFFLSVDQEQGLTFIDGKGQRMPIGNGRKLLQYVMALIGGTGNIQVTFFADSLTNQWPLTVTRALVAQPIHELECGGGSAIGYHIAIRFASYPGAGTDNGFLLQKLTAVFKQAGHLPVRGTI